MTTNVPATQTFQFDQHSIRTTLIDGQPWFVAHDIAIALGYSKTQDMYRLVDDEDKGYASCVTPGGNQSLMVLSESGVYAAVLRSKMPKAKPFARWVTAEVLPAIRRSGRYDVSAQNCADTAPLATVPAADYVKLLRELVSAQRQLLRAQKKLTAHAEADAARLRQAVLFN